jgi:hypothetical protein
MTTEPKESPLTLADTGSVSLRFSAPLDLAQIVAMLRVALEKLVDTPTPTLALRVDASMITLEGPATIDAADQRLVIARDMASDDYIDAIIRRHPDAPFEPPAPFYLRIAFVKRNLRTQHWQSQYVESHDEHAVLLVRLTRPELPLWQATDGQLAAALRIPSKSLSLERWTVTPNPPVAA